MGAGLGRGGSRYTGKKCRLISMFSLTVAFFFVEIVVGKLLSVFVMITMLLLVRLPHKLHGSGLRLLSHALRHRGLDHSLSLCTDGAKVMGQEHIRMG